jgi:hypothetical protein
MITWSPLSDLPPSLVELIDGIFGDAFLISHNRLARDLRKKASVVKALGDQGASDRVDGARRVYAREDVAAYLGRKCPTAVHNPATKHPALCIITATIS